MSTPERRLARDGNYYTYADFHAWYDTHATQMWAEAAATELNQTQSFWETAAHGSVPEPWETAAAASAELCERAADAAAAATEHSENTALQASSSSETQEPGAIAWDPLREIPAATTVCAFTPTRTATEHSLMQCVNCARPLCDTENLAFFWRDNKQGGVEVHLMLKPEKDYPTTFIRAPSPAENAQISWQCECGFKFGDTRAIGFKFAPMTAFKSSSVILCGQRFPGRKSQWPKIYNSAPFNTIEVRTRATYSGATPASEAAM